MSNNKKPTDTELFELLIHALAIHTAAINIAADMLHQQDKRMDSDDIVAAINIEANQCVNTMSSEKYSILIQEVLNSIEIAVNSMD